MAGIVRARAELAGRAWFRASCAAPGAAGHGRMMVVGQGQDAASAAGRKPTDAELDVYGVTHQGKVRASNQDHFLLCALRKEVDVYYTSLPGVTAIAEGERLGFLAMVADGVSGEFGEEAARRAVEHVSRYVVRTMQCYYAARDAEERLFSEALTAAALEVHADLVGGAGSADGVGHGATTLTLWLTVWPHAYLLQVGDSRCYVYRDGVLRQISRDQTFAEDLIAAGVLSADEARNTRWPHVLASAIGGPEAAPVVTRLEAPWRNVTLLCSDGLTKHVSDGQITERLRTMTSARQACEALLQDALDAGGSDNITIAITRAQRPPDG